MGVSRKTDFGVHAEMKTILLIATCAVVLATILSSEPGDAAEDGSTEEKGVLRHVVVFRFQPGTSSSDIAKVEAAFARLPEQIPTIRAFEWGTNNSPEGLHDGFTHCFLVTFADEAARDAYLPHPAHEEFVQILKPHLDKAFVFDYVAR